MANDLEHVAGAIHPPGDGGQSRPKSVEPGDKRLDPLCRRLLEKTEIATVHRGKEVRIHELLGVRALGEHEHRLAELEGLTDQLIPGGGDQRPASDEVLDESTAVDRMERQRSERLPFTEPVDPHRQSTIGQARQRCKGGMATQVADEVPAIGRHRAEQIPAQQRADLDDMLPPATEGRTEERRDDGVGGTDGADPHRMPHQPRMPLERPREVAEIVREEEMLVIDTQQRDPLASTGPRQGRLEIGNPEIAAKGLEFGHQAIGERSERPRLVLEPRRDRSDDIEAPPRVLEHEARDLPHLDIPGPGRMTKPEKRQRIGGGVDEDFVLVGQVLDERADPRRVPASLAAQTDRDPCHAVTPPATRPRRDSSSPSGPEPYHPSDCAAQPVPRPVERKAGPRPGPRF